MALRPWPTTVAKCICSALAVQMVLRRSQEAAFGVARGFRVRAVQASWCVRVWAPAVVGRGGHKAATLVWIRVLHWSLPSPTTRQIPTRHSEGVGSVLCTKAKAYCCAPNMACTLMEWFQTLHFACLGSKRLIMNKSRVGVFPCMGKSV